MTGRRRGSRARPERSVRAEAPGRVNLLGEHVDYNDGVVLPFAIGATVEATAGWRDDDHLVVRSAQRDDAVDVDLAALAPGRPGGWAAYAGGAVWALREEGAGLRGLDVAIDGRVPAGAGLSSSAAVECAVTLAVAALAGHEADPLHLARLAQRAENEFVGVPCGLMDQAASMLARAGHVLALDVAARATRDLRFDPAAAGLVVLVIDTRVHHDLADGAYAERRRSCEEAARRLGVASLRAASLADLARLEDPVLRRRVRHVVSEMARVDAAIGRLEAGDLVGLGPLMVASHESLRDDYEVSCAELDTAVEAALAAGALGARMTGGGFGGSAIALCPLDRGAAVESAVRAAAAGAGHPDPEIFPVAPSPGARLLRA
jgi:galactokinase